MGTEPAGRRFAPAHWGWRAYALLLLLPLLVSAASFGARGWSRVISPNELGYGEGLAWFQAQHILDRAIAYRTMPGYPYVASLYPPLDPLIVHRIAARTGSYVRVGRLLSLLAVGPLALAIGALVFLCARARMTKLPAALAGTVAALAPFQLADLAYWSALMRVDLPGLCLSFVALALVASPRPSASKDLAASVGFALAAFTKQVLVAAPLAAILVLALDNPRRAWRVAAVWIVVAAALYGTLGFATGGGSWRHLFLYARGPVAFATWFGGLVVELTLHPVLVLISAIVIVGLAVEIARVPARTSLDRARAFVHRGPFERLVALGGFYFVTSGITTAGYGRLGGDLNYFLEWVLCACLLAGCFVASQLGFERRGSSWVRAVGLALPLCLVVPGGARDALSMLDGRLAATIRGQREDRDSALVSLARRAGPPVLSDNTMVLMRAGLDIPADLSVVTDLSMSGVWDEAPYLSMLERGEFRAIITSNLREPALFTPGARRAIERAYVRAGSVAGRGVYLPRGAGVPPVPDRPR